MKKNLQKNLVMKMTKKATPIALAATVLAGNVGAAPAKPDARTGDESSSREDDSGGDDQTVSMATYDEPTMPELEEPDTTAPIGTVTSAQDTYVIGEGRLTVQSNEIGTAYITPARVSNPTAAELDDLYQNDEAVATMIKEANVSQPILTSGLKAGDYVVYFIDKENNVSEPSRVITFKLPVVDSTPPIITKVTPGSVTVGNNVVVKSNETGVVFLVKKDDVQNPKDAQDLAERILNLVNDGKAKSATVTEAGKNVSISTSGLSAGEYLLFAKDNEGNLSESEDKVTLTAASTRGRGSSGSGGTTSSNNTSSTEKSPADQLKERTPVSEIEEKDELDKKIEEATKLAQEMLETEADLVEVLNNIVSARLDAVEKAEQEGKEELAALSIEEVGIYQAVIAELTKQERIQEAIQLTQEIVERNYETIGKAQVAALGSLYEQIGDRTPKVIANGKLVKTDTTPVNENGRTLAPVRAISEALDAQVGWNNSTRTVTVERNGVVATMKIGENTLTVGDNTVELDVPARIIDGRTYIPVRAVGEALNAFIEYQAAGNIVIVEDLK